MKIFKYLLFNFIVIIIIFCIFETISYMSLIGVKESFFNSWNIGLSKSYDNDYNNIYKHNFREPVGIEYNSPPILILGCSFAQGYMLKPEDTFHYKLSKLTKRPVYNRAFNYLWGFHNAYYLFTRDDFYEDLPKINTIVYVYIGDHKNRAKGLYTDDISQNFEYLRYIYKNNKLYRYSFATKYPLFNLNIVKLVKKLFFLQRYNKNFDEISFYEKFFLEMRKKAEEHWGKCNFIILNYTSEDSDFDLMNKLKEDNFIIVNTNELTNIDINGDSNYHLRFDDGHPNGKAWDIVTPAFVNKMNL